MSYQVLARKWRPGRFSELVGQEHVVSAIANALDNDRLHHAYLFTGTRGVGKTTIARIFSKSLNCEEGMGSNPCGECDTCREIEQGRYVDLLEIDAASRTKVEDTRELLDNVQYKPTRGRYKVYLIDEVHMLSKHSFNALLKTLEEPPPHVKFLLATTDPQKLPVTILSRCLQFNLKALSRDQISQQLGYILEQESVPYEDAALSLLARSAQGSMRDALSLTDQAIAQGNNQVLQKIVIDMLGLMDKHQLLKLLHKVVQNEPRDALQLVEEMAQQSPDYGQILAELSSLFHQIALTQFVPDACKLETTSAKAIYQLAKQMSSEQVQLFYQIALEGRKDLPHAVDGKSAVEMTLLRMMAFAPAPKEDDPEILIRAMSGTSSESENLSETTPDTDVLTDKSGADFQSVASTSASENDNREHLSAERQNVSSSEPVEDSAKAQELYCNEPSGDSRADTPDFDAEMAQQMDDIEAQAKYEHQQATGSFDSVPDSHSTAENHEDTFQPHSSPAHTESLESSQPSDNLSMTQDMLALRQRIKRQRQEDAEQSKKPEPSKPYVPSQRPAVTNPVSAGNETQNSQGAHEVSADLNDTPPWTSASTEPPSFSSVIPDQAVTPHNSHAIEPGSALVDTITAHNEARALPTDTVLAPASVSQEGPLQPFLEDNSKLVDANQIDTWSQLISQMNVAGLVKQIALHSAFEKKDEVVTLELDESQAHLVNDNAVAQVQQALSTALKQYVHLQINIGKPAQTPFSLQQQINDMRQQHAHNLVSSDPLFTTLKTAFSAGVKDGSVRAR
ncbi:DNA polymerase III subunit gamma/tau [Salinimonas chungwhensis]|uniref:DNA polymerase III subunit gamma/tau n=1 Tax=Salinimonas chungwhensis TaxID=265425 RepID=UPI000380ACD5|nr:DNA polymerase III subunit gamma/tau [Salinimonas chungwhensis]